MVRHLDAGDRECGCERSDGRALAVTTQQSTATNGQVGGEQPLVARVLRRQQAGHRGQWGITSCASRRRVQDNL